QAAEEALAEAGDVTAGVVALDVADVAVLAVVEEIAGFADAVVAGGSLTAQAASTGSNKNRGSRR
ncbi:MAG: hypothetical protein ACRCWS_07355, partial [Propionibacteriaceae bacterium]